MNSDDLLPNPDTLWEGANTTSLINLRWKVFARVAQLGSLTKAATALDMQQSAISVQVGKLERECGGRLFSRTGRGVVLTSLGEQVFSRVQGILEEVERLAQDILASAHEPTGTVRVGFVSSLTNPLAIRMFRNSQFRNPRVRLEILEGPTPQIDEWLHNGTIDIGVIHRHGKQLPVGAEKLFDSPSWLVGKRLARQCERATVPFSALEMLPLVLPGTPIGLRYLEQIARRKGVRLNIIMKASSLTVLKEAVVEGDFYTILPYEAVYREASAGTLSISKIITPMLPRTAAVVTTTQRPLSYAARATVKVLREAVQDLLDSRVWHVR